MKWSYLFALGLAVSLAGTSSTYGGTILAGGGPTGGGVYRIDPNSGSATLLGDTGMGLYGMSVVQPGIIGATDGNRYYQFSLSDFQPTIIGPSFTTLTEGGLAFSPDSDTGYLAQSGGTPRKLYTIDKTSGSPAMFSSPITTTDSDISGLTLYKDGSLLALDLQGQRLFSVNKTTGVGTVIGSLGATPLATVGGLAYDAETDKLYAVISPSSGDAGFYEVDPLLGTATLIGSTGITSLGALTVIPAPSTLVGLLSMAALAGVAYARGRRRAVEP